MLDLQTHYPSRSKFLTVFWVESIVAIEKQFLRFRRRTAVLNPYQQTTDQRRLIDYQKSHVKVGKLESRRS
jgi:hypothetical protein